MSKKLIPLPVVEEKVGFKKSFIFEAVKNGTFPQPIRLGHRKTLWVEDEIDAWIEDRIQQRPHINTQVSAVCRFQEAPLK